MPTPNILLSPITFTDALHDRAVRALLPNSLNSNQLMELDPAIRNRAAFSAKVDSTRHLTVLDNISSMIIDPEHNPDGSQRQPGQYMNEARARALLRAHLEQLGYEPAPGDEGTIKDLRSTRRIRLQIEMPVSFARNYGHAAQMNDPAILDEFPGQRLLPSYANEPRPDTFWSRRWKAAGLPGPFGSDYVALKSDPGWMRLGIFGNPYPPFYWGSRREVEAVERNLCEEYGLIQPAETPEPMPLPERPIQSTIPEAASETLMQAILAKFPDATFKDGVLTQLT